MPVRAKFNDAIRGVATRVLPLNLRLWLRSVQRRLKLQAVPVGAVDFGSLKRLTPISPIFGKDRDLLSVERYYIERFLDKNRLDVRGRVMELGDPAYIKAFGDDRVTQIDILHYVEGNPLATIVADLTNAPHIPDNTFDCIIITQTLQMIYDARAAVETLHRILKPGGVVLCTSHGMSRVARREGVDDWGEYWHFTSQSKKRLFGEFFDRERLTVDTYGNVMSCVANLHGLAARELEREEIDYLDRNYELLVTVRAQKA